MGSIQLVVSSLVTVLVYVAIMAAVLKLFQIAGDVNEIKDLLRDIKRNTQEIQPPGLASAQSPANLLRAVSAETYPESLVEPPR